MLCDILVIGGGPAGSSAALSCSPLTVKVIVADKRRSLGEPIECAEFVPRLLKTEIDIPIHCIQQEIDTIQLYSTKGFITEFSSPGYMLDRTAFDKELAAQAIQKGVQYLINSNCVNIDKGTVTIQQAEEILMLKPKVIIGADGPRSMAGRKIQSENTDFVLGMQVELPLPKESRSLEIYFWPSFYGGYGWLFPKGNLANVGVGIRFGHQPTKIIRSVLYDFCQYLENRGKVKNTPLSLRFGLIPCSGLPRRVVADNILLVGDAGGQTHPITGAGIAPAIVCGKIAGQCGAKAIFGQNIQELEDYETKFRKIYQKEQDRAVAKRKRMYTEWDRLESIIPSIWPTFKEYYE